MSDPKYRRIARALRDECTQSEDGAQLPSEAELAAQFGVSSMTIRQALGVLEQEGLVTRVFGRGTYVQRRIVSKGDTLTSFSAEMTMRGLAPSTRLLGFDIVLANSAVANDLKIDSRDRVVRLERLRLADGEPLCVEIAHLPRRFAIELEGANLDGSLHAILETLGHTIETGTRRIRAVATNDRQSRLLDVPDNSPALNIIQVFSDAQGRPIQRADTVYRADRYEAYSQVRKQPAPHSS